MGGGCVHQIEQERQALAHAFHAERQPRVPGFDLEQCLIRNRACIDAFYHPMHRHAVRAFAMVDGPAGRVQTRVAGQRAWMEIEAADARRFHHGRMRDREGVNVEQEVDRFGLHAFSELAGFDELCRPARHGKLRRDVGHHGAARCAARTGRQHRHDTVPRTGQGSQRLHPGGFFRHQQDVHDPRLNVQAQRPGPARAGPCHRRKFRPRLRLRRNASTIRLPGG